LRFALEFTDAAEEHLELVPARDELDVIHHSVTIREGQNCSDLT